MYSTRYVTCVRTYVLRLTYAVSWAEADPGQPVVPDDSRAPAAAADEQSVTSTLGHDLKSVFFVTRERHAITARQVELQLMSPKANGKKRLWASCSLQTPQQPCVPRSNRTNFQGMGHHDIPLYHGVYTFPNAATLRRYRTNVRSIEYGGSDCGRATTLGREC